MQSCDPVSDWSDPVPAVETRRDFFTRMLDEGKQQNKLAPFAYAIAKFRERYKRSPKPHERRPR